MAITGLNYLVMRTLRQQKVLREKTAMIELGHANWYGDVPLDQLTADIQSFVTDPHDRDALRQELGAIGKDTPKALYRIAQIYFRWLAGCATRTTIDPGEADSDHKLDLNLPVDLGRRFDLVVNYGTGEHVFNVYQFYKTAHDLGEPGAIMIHSAPCTGWIDHGFYNFQPTFFADLAQANGYEMIAMLIGSLKPLEYVNVTSREHVIELAKAGKIPQNAMIEVVLRKSPELREFVTPMQGYYSKTISPTARSAWRELR